MLMETPQTFTDWIVGPMTKELQTIGSDEFLDVASKKGLTYVDYNADFGTPIEYRVGRHLEGAKELINWA
ncbi:MAG: deacylase, partial [Christensenellales bacterium]